MTDSVKFTDLGLSEPILKAISELGYETPSPIQAQGIPAVLEGSDLMAAAQTGTGKTAGFTLPLLDILSKGDIAKNNQARALVLTPTRELAAQIRDSVALYSKYLPLTTTVVFGGVKINPQMKRLTRGVDILVATPGRLLDLYQQKAVRFDDLEVLVLDEADRMLDMGFVRDIKKILALLPKKRQNLLFSATFSPDIRALAKTMVNNPVEVSVATRNTTAETVKQSIYTVDKNKKSALLIALIKQHQWPQVLVFSRTKHGANRLSKQLNAAGIKADAIHGNKSQGARTRALAEFKDNKTQVLVATDIAARGIDIDQLPQVINVDLPNVPEDYVHRIGRTGRAGSCGEAISLVCAEEFKELSMIERLIQKVLDRNVFDGLEPTKPVPASRLDTRPIKAKKPKKPKKDNSGGGHSNRSSNRSGRSSEGNQRKRQSRGNRSESGSLQQRSPRKKSESSNSGNSASSNSSASATTQASPKPATKSLSFKNKNSRIKDFGSRKK